MMYSGKELAYILPVSCNFGKATFKGDGLINLTEEISRQHSQWHEYCWQFWARFTVRIGSRKQS